MEKVFVYGSLRKGRENNQLVAKRGKFLGDVTLPAGEFCLCRVGWYPGVVCRSSIGATTPVVGEVYEVDEDNFQALDGYEGYPSLFTRVEVPTKHGDAWMYMYNHDVGVGDVVQSGDWLQEN